VTPEVPVPPEERVVSLGFRTDLALLRLGGSEITHAGDHLVVRTPHNPGFWWGNFLLLRDAPPPEHAASWLDRFAAVFPDARYRALGVDGTHGRPADLTGFTDAGLTADVSTVMTASDVHAPPRPHRTATYRALTTDDDWAQHVALEVACEGGGSDLVGHHEFVTRQAATRRALVEAGRGAWFGAFLDDRLVSQMGLLPAGDALARFQSVETHPDARGRGLAGTLVHHTARYGFDALSARTLVMVADPDAAAIRVYRSVGFTDSEVQLQVERAPAGSDGG
jgi:ribosomal protein S18 acetylase RimI-like enzyme